MEFKDVGFINLAGVRKSFRGKKKKTSHHGRWWMTGFRCQSAKHNSIMSRGWCVVQHYWRDLNNKPMEQVRKYVYDQISDKHNLLEETTIRYDNERRYEYIRSFECF